VRLCALALIFLSLGGCNRGPSVEAKPKPDISQRVRVENLPIRLEREQRLAEGETVKIIIVPGFPFGNRCIVYEGRSGAAIHCEEIGAGWSRADQLHRTLGVTYKTARFMTHRIREAMKSGSLMPLGGEGKTAEAIGL